MKKLILAAGLGTVLLFFACSDYSLPEKLSIKTSASLELPLGNGQISIQERASAGKLQEILEDKISESSSAMTPTVYEYNPSSLDKNVMQYIINYPIKEIPLTIGQNNLNNTNIDTIQIPETKFEAPDFNDSINITVSGQKFKIIELGEEGAISDIPVFFNITSPNFSTMTIRSGTMDITVGSPATVTTGFTLMAKLALRDSSGNAITDSTGTPIESAEQDLTNGGTVSLNLAGATIGPNLRVIISGRISGGEQGTENEYSIDMSPNSLRLSKITGLTMTNADLEASGNNIIYIPKNFNLEGLNSSLREATIKKGKLDFYCNLPEGWSGIKVIESNFMLRGGINIVNSDFSDSSVPAGYILYKEAILDTKTVKPESAYTYAADVTPGNTGTYTAENISWIKIEFKNATIIFADPSDPDVSKRKTELALSGECKIESLENIKIELSELDSFSGEESTGLNFSSLLSDIMSGDNKDLIDDIEFADSSSIKMAGYLFVTKPPALAEVHDLDELAIRGKVIAKYTDADNNSKPDLYILGTSSSNATLQMKAPSPSIAEAASESRIITDDSVFDDGNYSYKVADGVIINLINDKPDNLSISYNLGLDAAGGEIELNGDILDELKKGSDNKISVSLALVLPLQIKLKDEHDIPTSSENHTDGKITIADVMSLASSDGNDVFDSDVLKRDSAEDSEKWLKYAKAISSFKIIYNANNKLIVNLDEYTDEEGKSHKAAEPLEMRFYLYTVEEDLTTKKELVGENGEIELKIVDGQQIFELTTEDILAVLQNYPFIPRVRAEISLPVDNNSNSMVQYVPNNGLFGLDGKVQIKFNEEVPIELWSK